MGGTSRYSEMQGGEVTGGELMNEHLLERIGRLGGLGGIEGGLKDAGFGEGLHAELRGPRPIMFGVSSASKRWNSSARCSDVNPTRG